MSNINITVVARHAVAFGGFVGGSTPVVPGVITNDFWIQHGGDTRGIFFGYFQSGSVTPSTIDTHDGDNKKYFEDIDDTPQSKRLEKERLEKEVVHARMLALYEEIVEGKVPHKEITAEAAEIVEHSGRQMAFRELKSMRDDLGRMEELLSLYAQRKREDDEDISDLMDIG